MSHENTNGTTDVAERKGHYPVFLYATHKLNDTISLGFGINTPFGLSTSWSNSNSATRQVATLSDIKTLEFNPNIAFKVNDKLSLAVGIVYAQVDATLDSMYPLAPTLTVRTKGDGDGWGANAAAFYKATDNLNLGLSYRSEILLKVDGKASVGPTSNSATTEVTLPDILQLGASYKVSDKLTLNTDLWYTWWSTYDRLIIKSATFSGGSVTSEKQWKDVWTLRLGGQYKLTDQWKLRAGYLYDKNPVPEDHFETRIPDSDRQGVSVGAGYTVGNLTIDAAYLYLHMNTRHINDSTSDNATTNPNSLNGTYKSDVHLASLMVGYKF
jgi:long-chain fatty acid transport protein